jgi:hypothetical protein
MNRGRVGEEMGGKETDGCPLTVMVAGCQVHLLDRDKKTKKTSLFFLLVSVSGVVGADPVGQLIGHVYGGWLGDNSGGGGHCHQGWWVRVWV